MRRRGSQVTSFAWTSRLTQAGTRISMDGKGRCIDAAVIERSWRSLDYDCVCLPAWETGSQAKAGVGAWMSLHDHQPPHSAHGGSPPAMVCQAATQSDRQAQQVAQKPTDLVRRLASSSPSLAPSAASSAARPVR